MSASSRAAFSMDSRTSATLTDRDALRLALRRALWRSRSASMRRIRCELRIGSARVRSIATWLASGVYSGENSRPIASSPSSSSTRDTRAPTSIGLKCGGILSSKVTRSSTSKGAEAENRPKRRPGAGTLKSSPVVEMFETECRPETDLTLRVFSSRRQPNSEMRGASRRSLPSVGSALSGSERSVFFAMRPSFFPSAIVPPASRDLRPTGMATPFPQSRGPSP